jgi:HEAT repeat protein
MNIKAFILCASLCLTCGCQTAFAQPVFPLPTREQRLVAEARDSKTPVSQLIQMLRIGSYGVKMAASQTLLQRKDPVVLKELQAAVKLEDEADSEIRRVIDALQNPRTVNAQEVEALAAILNRKEFDDPRYAADLIYFVQLAPTRALPLIEEYLTFLPYWSEHPINSDKEVGDNRLELQKLYWPIKWRNFNLNQKVAYFISWNTSCAALRQNKPQQVPLVDGVSSALAREGNAVIPALKRIAMDEKVDTCLFEYTMSTLSEIGTPQAMAALRLISQSDDAKKSDVARQILLNLGDQRAAQEELPRVIKELSIQNPANTKAYDLLWQAEKLAKAGADRNVLEDAVQPYIKQGNLVAVTVVRSFGSEKSVDTLIDIINAPPIKDDYQQSLLKPAAITTLSFVGRNVPEKVLPVLLGVAISSDASLRIVGAQGLGRLQDKVALPILVDFVKKEKDPTVLLFQVSAIYFIGGSEASKSLVSLKDYAQTNSNSHLKELVEEGLLRLERENRSR